jgi:hypothetical protein
MIHLAFSTFQNSRETFVSGDDVQPLGKRHLLDADELLGLEIPKEVSYIHFLLSLFSLFAERDVPLILD